MFGALLMIMIASALSNEMLNFTSAAFKRSKYWFNSSYSDTTQAAGFVPPPPIVFSVTSF